MGIGLMWAAGCMGATAVSVVSVRFDERRLPGSSYPWTEGAVQLRSVTGNNIPENVQLKMWWVYNQPTGKQVFAGAVKLYSLNDPATVRFYLPPDVIRSKRLSQNPSGYYIEISSSAGAENFESKHASPSLTLAKERAELKNLPTLPLVPHAQTPFYSISETQRELPAYVAP